MQKKQTDNIYNVAHPELVEDSIKLQVHFFKITTTNSKEIARYRF